MANPFRRSGKTRHCSGEWLAEPVGLCGLVQQEFGRKAPGAVALIGEVGSGKTAALDLWQRLATAEGACILPIQMDILPLEDAQRLENVVLNKVLERFDLTLGDRAASTLWPNERIGAGRARRKYRQDEEFELLAEVLRQAPQRVHLLLEECQGPAELLAVEGGRLFATWAIRLQRLTEVVRAGDAFLVATITRSPWDQLPRSCRDGFVRLAAQPPNAAKIAVFLREGLSHADEVPHSFEPELEEFIYEKSEILNLRELHERCAVAWQNAHDARADTLRPEHFEEA